jgi:hypothetical protein
MEGLFILDRDAHPGCVVGILANNPEPTRRLVETGTLVGLLREQPIVLSALTHCLRDGAREISPTVQSLRISVISVAAQKSTMISFVTISEHPAGGCAAC